MYTDAIKPLQYRRIGLTVKSGLSEKDEVVSSILDILQKLDAEVFIDERRCASIESTHGYPLVREFTDIDLLLVIGGDGSILRAVREMPNLSVPLLSVNRGAVGFLAETNLQEAAELLPTLLTGGGVVEERSLLYTEVRRKDEVIHEMRVLNEAVIAQGAISRILNLRASINGEVLTTYQSDGLIIATPTGSTAYSLAAGGPIVHPSLSATILTPLNPHSFSQKPLVIPGKQTIEIEVLPKGSHAFNTEVSLTLDGQTYVALQAHDRVLAHMNNHTVKFLRRRHDTFYSTLRSKLKWGERMSQRDAA